MDFSSSGLAKPALFAAVVALVVAAAGGLLTDIGPWYKALKQPSWKPPDWAFGPIWTVIFTLTAFAGVMAWRVAPPQDQPLVLWAFLINGAINIGWSFFYFTLKRPDWALWELGLLWLSILALIFVCWPHSRLASALLIPYLVWVSIAGTLNWSTIRLNGPF